MDLAEEETAVAAEEFSSARTAGCEEEASLVGTGAAAEAKDELAVNEEAAEEEAEEVGRSASAAGRRGSVKAPTAEATDLAVERTAKGASGGARPATERDGLDADGLPEAGGGRGYKQSGRPKARYEPRTPAEMKGLSMNCTLSGLF